MCGQLYMESLRTINTKLILKRKTLNHIEFVQDRTHELPRTKVEIHTVTYSANS